jgi:hypothetical protein
MRFLREGIPYCLPQDHYFYDKRSMKTIREIFLSHAERDANGRHVNGTDKQTNHNYGEAYERLFAGMRQDAITLIEIGVADGSSLLAWQEIFPNAKIVGMDIHLAQRVHRHETIECYMGDQSNQDDCQRVSHGRQFDIIVEDALHELDATLLTLFWLWPAVKPGGMYIVEEWANVGGCRENIRALFPDAEIVDTQGPFGGIEPLVVLRKRA